MKQIHKKIVLSISFLGTVIAPIPVFTVSCSNKSSLKSDSLAAKHAAIEAKKKEAKAAKVKVNHSASTTSATSNNTTAADNSNKHTLKINPTTDGSHIIVNSNTYSRSTYNKQIEHGKRVEIQTIPDDGLIFDKWSDGCVQNPRILRVNDDIELTAHFIEKPTDVVKKNTITYNNKEYELVDYIDPNVFSTDGSLNLILNDNWQHLKIAAQDKDGITALSLHTCNQHVDFIGDNFLSHCHNLQKLDISDLEQIVTIGDKFLYWCDSFNSEYKLPNSVQQIGDCFMKFCTKFNQRLEMPEMLFLLGKSPFYGCDALDVKRKVINNQWNVLCRNVIVVGDEQYDLVDDIDPNVFSNLDTCNTWSYFWTAFGRCWGYLFASAFSALLTPLRELTSPLKNIFGYTSVWKYTGHFTTDDIIDLEIPLLDGTKKRVARDGIRSLQLLSCDPKVKKIEDNFLFHCISLEWLDLYGLNNIESVGNNFLSLCSKLNCPLQFPSSLKSIGNCFMRQCDSYNQPIVMPDEITHMSDSFMAGCHSFNTTLTLPKKLKTIGVGFLGWCDSMMHKVIVPEGVTSIGSYFMYDCHVFNCTPNLPKTLKSIGDHFMSACYLFNRNTVLPDRVFSKTVSVAWVLTEKRIFRNGHGWKQCGKRERNRVAWRVLWTDFDTDSWWIRTTGRVYRKNTGPEWRSEVH